MADILHSDLNNFYASVEIMLNPALKGKELVVGGSIENRSSIVLAKSIEAKRKGVKTGETIYSARKKCKDLIVVPPNYDMYMKYSKLVRDIYLSFTDFVEPFGIDECWLDVTNSKTLFGSARDIAEMIRRKTKAELGLTVSIGVSYNKILAKMGSNYKKPDAITVIDKNNFRDMIWKLDVSEMTGIGRKSAEKLYRHNIFTIGELANTDVKLLRKILGKNGIDFYHYANGIDTRRVQNCEENAPVKSIGNGFTLKKNLRDKSEVQSAFSKLALKVSSRLRDGELYANTIEISIKDSSLLSVSFQKQLPFPTQSASVLKAEAYYLFKKMYKRDLDIRAVGIRCSKLSNENITHQINMAECSKKNLKLERLDATVYSINKKFGRDKVTYGNIIGADFFPTETGAENVLTKF